MDLLFGGPLAVRLALFVPLVLSLSVHEWAHAWTASKLGDDTALRLRRVTFNPLAHIDPVGTVLFPLMGVPVGWAKPVPFNPLRFRRTVPMELGRLLVAAAGPVSNLVFALICAGALAFLNGAGLPGLTELPGRMGIQTLLLSLISMNVTLAIFNLLPLPPLDGSHIIEVLCPRVLRPYWAAVAAQGPVVLIFLLLILPLVSGIDLLGAVLTPVQSYLFEITVPLLQH